MTPFEKRISRATADFCRVLDDRFRNFPFLMVEEEQYVGVPCKKGHVVRYTKGGNCVQCSREYARKKRELA